MLKPQVLHFLNVEGLLEPTLLGSQLLKSQDFNNALKDLEAEETHLVLKFLIESKSFQEFNSFIEILDRNSLDYDPVFLILALIETSSDPDLINFFKKNLAGLQSLLRDSDLTLLSPHLSLFPEALQKNVEKSLHDLRQREASYKEELLDQVTFLKMQNLEEKALEIEKKINFHFPEPDKSSSQEKTKEKTFSRSFSHPQSLKYGRVLDRNLSFNQRSKERTKVSQHLVKKLQEERKKTLNLAETWKASLAEKDLDLLLTQLEFLNLENPKFYASLLKRPHLDDWTKAYLYLKAELYFEGLAFLDQMQASLLENSSYEKKPEFAYNFYYTKGMMLLGAGMIQEAERIFLAIKEQNENFRDIQILLQSLK